MNWFSRKFRNAPNEMLSESTGELGELGVHLGEWCKGFEPGAFVAGIQLVDRPNPEATLVTSLMETTPTTELVWPGQARHAPVLDLDVEHVYYESSTPGHAALLLNVNLSDVDYWRLIDVLEDCGIIQHGFAEASRQRGYSACRTPWTKKPAKSD